MKSRREWPWFVIPFVLLPVRSSLGSLMFPPQTSLPAFVGDAHYIKLLMADPLFWVSAGISQLTLWGIGAVLALVLGLAVCLLRRWIPLSRRLRYVVIFGAATMITAIVWLVGTRLVPTVYNVLFFVQIGNAAAFFVWLVEKIRTAVKKPKQEVETQ